jgi:ABC-type multidrug transport system fused ATPase/permease subunit
MRSDNPVIADRIHKSPESIADWDVDGLVGVGRPDGQNFNQVRGYISASLDLIKSLAKSDLDSVPDQALVNVWNAEGALITSLRGLANFHATSEKNSNRHQAVLTALVSNYENFFGLAAPIIAFSRKHPSNTAELEHHARELVRQISTIRQEGEQLYSKLQTFKLDSVVSNQSELFAKEADTHEKYAKLWLLGVGLSALFILVAAFYVSAHAPTALVHDSVPLTLFAYVPRLLVLSIAFYALALCARNYRTSRHNFIVNRHRSVALKTFNVFATSAADQKVKDAILAQAASTIFSAQPSGYSVDQAEPLPQATAVELLQRIAGK